MKICKTSHMFDFNQHFIFFRRLKCNQNKSNVAHCPKVATVETPKIVAVGQSKRESSSKIQTVFKRSKSPKLKNKRIPEVLYHIIYLYILILYYS